MRFWLILGVRHTATEKDTNLMDVFMQLQIFPLTKRHSMQKYVQQSLRKQPSYQVISKGSHLVVIQ